MSAIGAVAQSKFRRHRAVIVNFHQFINANSSVLRKGPSVHTHVDTLDRLLQFLGRRYRFMSLSDMVDRLQWGSKLQHDVAVVTIDDGYRNNLTLGLPVFLKHRVPVTLYVATGYIGTNKLLPMEQVGYMLQQTRCTTLQSSLLGSERHDLTSTEQKRQLNSKISSRLKQLEAVDQSLALRELGGILKVDLDGAPGVMLTWDEVRELQAAGFEIGSHAVSHNIMTRMPIDVARRELHESKSAIEAELGVEVRHFAFPNGEETDFSDVLRDIASDVGYDSVASVTRGTCTPGTTSPMNLNRVGLTDSAARTAVYIERLMWRREDSATPVNFGSSS